MKKYILTVGLNDKKTLTQLIRTETAKHIIMKVASEYVNGCTLTEQIGFYKHDDGRLTFETAIKIELVFIKKTDVIKFANWLKTFFNQETILFESVNINSKLI